MNDSFRKAPRWGIALILTLLLTLLFLPGHAQEARKTVAPRTKPQPAQTDARRKQKEEQSSGTAAAKSGGLAKQDATGGTITSASTAGSKKGFAPAAAQAAEGQARFRDDNPGQRERWFYEQRARPLGFIPFGIRQQAVRQRDAMRERERQLRIGSFALQPSAAARITAPDEPDRTHAIPPNGSTWTPIGPQPATAALSTTIKQVSGRTSAVAVDPTNANIVYSGGAQGGIWKSTNAGATWTPLSDFEASLAIGSIAIDPTNPQTIYVGTGEQTFSIGSYYGAGILKSTDGGMSWTPMGQSTFVGPFGSGFAPGGGARIGSLAINPTNTQLILAGVQISTGSPDAGIYCSNDGGNTWVQVVSGAVGTEVLYDPNGTTAWAALGRIGGDAENGVYRSTNANQPCAMQTWTARNGTSPNNLPSGTSAGRIELAIAPSSPNTLYASIANPAGTSDHLLGVFKTTDAGANWMRLAQSNTLVGGASGTVCSAQCWYDHVMRVHPNNPNVVYLGGAATGFGLGNYLIRSTDGGNNWTGIAKDSNGDQLHVDQHAMAFAFSGMNATRLYIGNDGGVWSTDVSGGGAGAIDWVNHNGPAAGSSMALGTLQYYPGHSIHPADTDTTIGGTQDNGTHLFSGTLGWQELNVCGDGGYTAIDPGVPTTLYATCQNIDINKSLDGGTNFSFANGNINSGDSSAFIPPLIIDTNINFAPFARRQLYFGTFRVWRGDSDPMSTSAPTWTAISPDLTNGGGDIMTIAVSPNDSRIVWAGTSNGLIQRTLDGSGPGLASWSNVTVAGQLPAGRVVTSLAVSPHDPTSNTVYATFSGFTFGSDTLGHVFRTTNSGAAWSDISSNLPNTPVNDIIVDPDVPFTLYVGTDMGVFISTDDGASWMTFQSGFPNVAVLGIKLHRPTRLLRASTHGRGMWDLLLTNFNPTFNLATMNPTSAQAGDPDTMVTVTGVGFTGSSVVQFNGNALVTDTTGAPTQLTATIPAAMLATGQTAAVTVFDPTQMPTITNSLPFSVLNPTPTLTSISPNMANPGSGGFALTLMGTNFLGTVGGTPTTQVRWNGSVRSTNAMLVNATTITVDIPASDVASGGLNLLTVFNPSPGGGSSNAQTFTVGTPPPNDNFVNAIVISGTPFSNSQDTSAASQEMGEPNAPCTDPAFGGTGNFHSIWYQFTPASNMIVAAGTTSAFDTVLSVWTGNAVNALTNVACDDDSGPPAGSGFGFASQLTVSLTAGTTYYFMVGGFCDPTDPNCPASQVPGYLVAGAVTFNLVSPPPNDDFANAIVINTTPFMDTQDNSAATEETNDPIPQVTTGCPSSSGFPGQGRFRTIWYRFTPANNVIVDASLAGSNYDTVLSVWTGPALGSLTQVDCDDDGVAFAGPSRLTNLALTAGTTYHFMAAGWSQFDFGTSTFNLTLQPDYALTANPAAVTVTRGQTSAPITVTVTPMNGAFSSAITFSCTGLPSRSSCLFNPTSLTPGSNPATTTLTITTTAPGMIPGAPSAQPWTPPPVLIVLLALLAIALFAVVRAGFKPALAHRPAWRTGCYLAAVLVLAVLAVSCGGGGGGGGGPTPPPNPGTPPGTYMVSVRGVSGSITRTTTVTLTVQ